MAQQVVWGLIIASGRAQQLTESGAETAFLGVGSRPALAHSLAAFDRCLEVEEVVLVVTKERVETARALVRRYGGGKPVTVVPGFLSQRASVRAGLQAADPDAEWMVVHDASRPCITPEMIGSSLATARRYGNGITASPVLDTVAWVKGRSLRAETAGTKDAPWLLQSPQAYKRELLERALDIADNEKMKAEDVAAALPLIKEPIRLVPCATANIRLSTADDLALAANLLL